MTDDTLTERLAAMTWDQIRATGNISGVDNSTPWKDAPEDYRKVYLSEAHKDLERMKQNPLLWPWLLFTIIRLR